MEKEFEINFDPDMANQDEMTIFINFRVLDSQGNFIGATGVGLTVHAVKSLIRNYQEKYNRRIYFVNQEGEIQLSSLNGKESVKNITKLTGYGDFKKRIGDKILSPFTYKKDGEMVHVNLRYINQFNWILIVEQSEKKRAHEIIKSTMLNLLISAVVTIIILVLITFTIKIYQRRIDTLQGIVPICSFCKQIRDDKGYWSQVEEYIEKHTEAEFTHGICPDCLKKHYPKYREKKK